MTAHPSDQAVAQLIRNARVGAAASGFPTRTRTVGEAGARQCSVGRLVMEAARADAGVSDEVSAARREVIASELERRRLEEAAAEARRFAERDVQHAEAERDEAVARARRMGGPSPDFLTLALIAAATFEIAEADLIHVIDEALTDNADLGAWVSNGSKRAESTAECVRALRSGRRHWRPGIRFAKPR